MSLELINLLPRDRQRRLEREYYLRLATVAIFALVAVALIGTGLLAPSFLYLHEDIQSQQSRIDAMDKSLATPSGASAGAQLSSLSAEALYLSRLASTTTASAALAGVLAAPRAGIVLTSLTFTPPTPSATGSMTLTGSANTREDLRAYVAALAALPYVSAANLPISAYAKETDIPFSIALTGTPAPAP